MHQQGGNSDPDAVRDDAPDGQPEAQPDDKAGLDREVGDFDDPEADDDDALPGRAGGGLAGG